jgi:murein DD-endopeptidase MepM/ murein hydrolase activator NlpD
MHKPTLLQEFQEFWLFLWDYVFRRLRVGFKAFETSKGSIVDVLYRRRGKYARPFVHTSMIGFVFIGVTLGPVVFTEQTDSLAASELPQGQVLGMTTEDVSAYGTSTISGQGVVEYRGGEIVDYEVKEGETISQIAQQFSLNPESILWANGLDSEKQKIKAGQVLKILPVDGVVHKVKKGETVYSIAKKYEANPQGMVDYPFNEFTDDESFALAVGQVIMVPDGVMPKQQEDVSGRTTLAQKLTPDAGQVSSFGSFVWPASGYVSQGYRFYHKAIDIANKGAGPILAADGGTVIGAGWLANEGYGNRVMVDHGNGYVTLYAHMSSVAVVAGQRVNRGDVLGQMGSTGRSTGTHLHFEIRTAGGLLNPLNFLK